MFLSHLTIDKDLNEKKEDQGCIMSYKEICSLCKGNGYIKVVIDMGKEEIKQCWMCESKGEKEYANKPKRN